MLPADGLLLREISEPMEVSEPNIGIRPHDPGKYENAPFDRSH